MFSTQYYLLVCRMGISSYTINTFIRTHELYKPENVKGSVKINYTSLKGTKLKCI